MRLFQASIVITLFLISCSANHYHDGKYLGRIGSGFNVHFEALKINGSEIEVEKYDLTGQVFDKAKVTCTQYDDRIEYQDIGGVTRILTVENGDLKLNDYSIYKNIDKEKKTALTQQEEQLKKDGSKGDKIAFVNQKLEKDEKIRTHSEDEYSYDYVKNVRVNPNEKFWQGVKSFEGHIDDVYKVTINGSAIKIEDANLENPIVVDGIIKNGRILKGGVAESDFRYKNSLLYHYSENEWMVFYPLAQ